MNCDDCIGCIYYELIEVGSACRYDGKIIEDEDKCHREKETVNGKKDS